MSLLYTISNRQESRLDAVTCFTFIQRVYIHNSTKSYKGERVVFDSYQPPSSHTLDGLLGKTTNSEYSPSSGDAIVSDTHSIAVTQKKAEDD